MRQRLRLSGQTLRHRGQDRAWRAPGGNAEQEAATVGVRLRDAGQEVIGDVRANGVGRGQDVNGSARHAE
ncbi:MAG: hypothetical protein IPJ56_18360 [Gemmatimonadetes bacterium]|nr:hypothetical protein [Gemmatimonadota bacterium]